VPPKAVPSDVDDAAVRAAVHAVGAELPGAPGTGNVPHGSLPKALEAPACASFCALSKLLAACSPEEEVVKAVAAAPVVAAPPVAAAAPVAAAPRAVAAVPARPPRAHSPDLFSDSDSDCTEAVAAAPASKTVQLPKAPAPQPVCKASTLAADLVAAWSEPCALAALMQRADPFLAELSTLLCA
jgi:Meckel syndrome type 1 protein